MNCGLLGRKLGHSYSPQIHAKLGDYKYGFFEVEPENLGAFLTSGTFDGINVTIPYKKDVIPYCSQLSADAKRIGSVNTITNRGGKLYGDNTDCYGFRYMIQKSGCEVSGKKAIVLGSGGASLTVCDVLRTMGAGEIRVISRKGDDNYENIERHYDADIIVNATPVGMYPNNGESLVDLTKFNRCKCVLDIVYNPSLTALLLQAEKLNIPHENGLTMLVAQAKRASELFTGTEIPDSVIDEITFSLRASMKNIILIGMPGCGKSSVGKIIANSLNRDYFDCDGEFENRYGVFPGDFITKYGEAEFRKKETELLKDLCKRSSCVISTGGGCVTIPENYGIMHQNGTIVWIRRDISQLATDGRPLSLSSGNEKLYAVRAPLYTRFSDLQADNDGLPENTAENIMRSLKL